MNVEERFRKIDAKEEARRLEHEEQVAQSKVKKQEKVKLLKALSQEGAADCVKIYLFDKADIELEQSGAWLVNERETRYHDFHKEMHGIAKCMHIKITHSERLRRALVTKGSLDTQDYRMTFAEQMQTHVRDGYRTGDIEYTANTFTAAIRRQ